MLGGLAKKIFGSHNERILKQMSPMVEKINAMEPEFEKLSDENLKAKTAEFKKRIADGATLDELLPEAFATVREAARRTLEQRPFDVQLMGAIALHQGKIAEMKTGEGKTLTSTLAVYLNAIEGKGVHVVTVNDYLAKRDSEWMGKVYEFLGLSVGCIINDYGDEERKQAYNSDITYGTNNEFGFDYLRDNMKFSRAEMVQRRFNYAIVDEVDSILIDEARTPLIISGPMEDNSELYVSINKYIPKLKKEDYELDEKSRSVTLSEDGMANMEQILIKAGVMPEGESLYDISNVAILHHVNQALRAHKLFEKDKEYIVKDNKVVIIDEFTGRMMDGRRFSEGLHQALEAKEGVRIQNENQTLASITFQNYFRMYPKLAGMTGTAMTEAAEFEDIYRLEVTEIPTHMPVSRKDEDDVIYRTMAEKDNAIVEQIKDCHKRKQPVLVGTISIEKSESLARVLKKQKIPHNVLNARYHEQEAQIISQAGRPGAVTIATNMAGRGTDIMLGGNPEMLAAEKASKKELEKFARQCAEDKKIVLAAGGLFVLGTERHESRRIDNQLRGRSGRQGDPGGSRFFLSLEDDLMRIFGSERIDSLLQKIGFEEGESIQHPWMNRALEKAQQKVEARNYEIRKNLLKFDDVMNDQRKVIYEQRIELMEAKDVSETAKDMREEVIEDLISAHIPEKAYAEQWETESLEKEIFRVFGGNLPIVKWAEEEGIADKEIYDRTVKEVEKIFTEKEEKYGHEIMRDVEKKVLLFTLDQLWKDHLLSLDQLRQGIYLRAYGQKDPLNEYKREAFVMFEQMLASLRETVTTRLSHLALHFEGEGGIAMPERQQQRMVESRTDPAMQGSQAADESGGIATNISRNPDKPFDPNDPSSWGRIGRNEPCPCGSGKKFKQCHGRIG